MRLVRLLWIWMVCLAFPLTAWGGTEAFSLAMSGRLVDVQTLRGADGTRYYDAALLTQVARLDGHLSLSTRPDRGHIALSNADKATVAEIKGFKLTTVTFIVEGKPKAVSCRLNLGSPYITAADLTSVLEPLGFSVLSSEEMRLLTVTRLSQGYRVNVLGVGGAVEPDPQRAVGDDPASMLRQLQAASLQAAGGTMGSRSPGSDSDVCRAMDKLRASWDSTEPSAAEKAAFRSLSSKLQETQQSGGQLQASDLEQLHTQLASFRRKVDTRSAATKAWVAPDEALGVKGLGVTFMQKVTDAVALSQKMTEAMRKKDQSAVAELQSSIDKLKELDQDIQTVGGKFNLEVTRVREAHGCGPATLGLPPS